MTEPEAGPDAGADPGPDAGAVPAAQTIRGDGVTLVPVTADQVARILVSGTAGHSPARGWPHDDTPAGLAFAALGGWTWVIVDADGEIVGECGVKAAPGPDAVVEIGYGLAAPRRGRGLGSRAVRALVGWLAERPDVRAIEAETDAANVASQRVLERAGFVRAGGDDTVLRWRRPTPGDAPARGR